jgi:hypothetical protein
MLAVGVADTHAVPEPGVVFHADWSNTARKRWAARAVLRDGSYLAHRTEPVADPGSLLRSLPGTSVLAGFDFPIGVPHSWAQRVGVTSFRELLSIIGRGEWRDFFDVAENRGEITLRRPFYPARPGGRRHAHLVEALGMSAMDDLLRRCERRQPDRRAACALFWTLGGNQVGKAALTGWRDVLVPALDRIALWPFGGPLEELLRTHRVVVVETYPGEVYRHLGVAVRKSARQDRARHGSTLRAAASRLGVELLPELQSEIDGGFASDDQFDAFVGLLGMIDVVRGRSSGEPRDDRDVVTVEGWILGQTAL